MRKDSLLYFANPTELDDFIAKLDIYKGWKICSGRMNDRGKLIKDKNYTNELRALFEKKQFFRKAVSLAEIVSWLDNLVFIQRLFKRLRIKLKPEIFNNISISVEYMVKMSKRMRVDYVLVFDKRILILEMRMVDSFEKIRSTWEKKFRELLIYKELMSYYILGKTITLFALIPMFEYRNKMIVPKNVNYNNNQLDFLTEYIIEYITY